MSEQVTVSAKASDLTQLEVAADTARARMAVGVAECRRALAAAEGPRPVAEGLYTEQGHRTAFQPDRGGPADGGGGQGHGRADDQPAGRDAADRRRAPEVRPAMSQQANTWAPDTWAPERVEILSVNQNNMVVCEAHSWLYPMRQLRRVFIRGGSKANCYVCVEEVRKILKAKGIKNERPRAG